MLQNCNEYQVLKVFFKEPTEKHYLLEVSRKVNLSHTSVTPILERLVKENLIMREFEIKGKRKFPIFLANLESPKFIINKKMSNLFEINFSNLPNYLSEHIFPKAIVLFGSYSRGEDTENSDIDLFILSKKKEINLEKFEELLNRKIELHFSEDFKSLPNEIKNNILNGIILGGFLKVFNDS